MPPMDDPEGRFRDLEEASRPTFKLLIRAEPGVDEATAYRKLRWVLKGMWRGHKLRCLSVTQVNDGPERR